MLERLFDAAVGSYVRDRRDAARRGGAGGPGGVRPRRTVALERHRRDAALSRRSPRRRRWTPYSEYLNQGVLYTLWDCGLKVGHSTRTVDQVFVEAGKDIQTKTSILESQASCRIPGTLRRIRPGLPQLLHDRGPEGLHRRRASRTRRTAGPSSATRSSTRSPM